MSIIGFDDIPSTEWMNHPLTTVRQPLREMGSIAVDLLLQQIAGEPLKLLRVELATSLVTLQSCAPLRNA
jgi:DNA-binding LacI/PurR family transcriptional regulator